MPVALAAGKIQPPDIECCWRTAAILPHFPPPSNLHRDLQGRPPFHLLVEGHRAANYTVSGGEIGQVQGDTLQAWFGAAVVARLGGPETGRRLPAGGSHAHRAVPHPLAAWAAIPPPPVQIPSPNPGRYGPPIGPVCFLARAVMYT